MTSYTSQRHYMLYWKNDAGWLLEATVRKGMGFTVMGWKYGAWKEPGTPRPPPPHSALGPDVTARPRGHPGLRSITEARAPSPRDSSRTLGSRHRPQRPGASFLTLPKRGSSPSSPPRFSFFLRTRILQWLGWRMEAVSASSRCVLPGVATPVIPAPTPPQASLNFANL